MHSSHFISAQDGLKLHVRAYGPRTAAGPPVVCLPGLARTSGDFDTLATALSAGPERRYVVAMDSRGRGRSDYDRDPGHYSFAVELADVLAVITALDIGPAVFVGTSRGGILTMLLASARPMAIAGAVLNDIGPVIERQGLARIKSYVGKLPQAKNFADGAEILRRLFAPQFPKLASEDWIAYARRTFEERNGRLIPNYDAKLARTFEGIDLERPLPHLWPAFEALANMPLMVIRGANSDVLSAETVAAMRARRPNMDTIEVPDQGHAPLLMDADTIERIRDFAARCLTPPRPQ
jgi:pimeloyl-ACP methyl ester carboxylesterase